MRVIAGVVAAVALALPGATIASSGGAAPTRSAKRHSRPARHGHWLRGFAITEYWPSPESWFVGKLVAAAGIPGLHHIDWLYSAAGVSMQGQGVGLDGQLYHMTAFGSAPWVTAAGRPTTADSGFAAGAPYWRAGAFWRNRHGGVTFPLQAGGWSNGAGRRYVPLRGVRFAPGPSLPLTPWRSIAVDPSVIPLGSRVYIPAYKNDGYGGWFTARDTGGAVRGRRIDVYRPPPATPNDPGQSLSGERVFVAPPSK